MAALGEQQVEVQVLGEALVELDAGVVEARALGRLVVGAQDRGVAPGGARADVALLEDRHVGDPVVAEVVRGGQAVRAAADDHHVVGALELRLAAPHPALAEDVKHATASCAGAGPGSIGQRVDADRPAAEVVAGVGDDRPHVLAGGPPEQEQVAIRRLADQDPRLAGDRAGPQRADRSDLRAQVDRAEAGEHLARQRPGQGQRGEVRGHVDDVDARPAAAQALAERRRRLLADHERAGRRQPAPPGAVAARTAVAERRVGAAGAPRRSPRAGALELELAQVRHVGPAGGARQPRSASCSAPRRSRRRRSSRRGPRTARPPRRRCAPSASGRPASASPSAASRWRQEVEVHERSTSPSGS